MTSLEIMALVQKHLGKYHPGGAGLTALDIRQDGRWWHVSVKPTFEPPHRYEYSEALAEVESELQEDAGLTILLVPVIAEPQAVAA